MLRCPSVAAARGIACSNRIIDRRRPEANVRFTGQPKTRRLKSCKHRSDDGDGCGCEPNQYMHKQRSHMCVRGFHAGARKSNRAHCSLFAFGSRKNPSARGLLVFNSSPPGSSIIHINIIIIIIIGGGVGGRVDLHWPNAGHVVRSSDPMRIGRSINNMQATVAVCV